MLLHTSGTGTCFACCDRDAPMAAHTWAARRGPTAYHCRWGSVARTAQETCSYRCDCDAPGAAIAWAGAGPCHRGRRAGVMHERHGDVFDSLQSQRADGSTDLDCPAQARRMLWLAVAVATHERHGDVRSSLRY